MTKPIQGPHKTRRPPVLNEEQAATIRRWHEAVKALGPKKVAVSLAEEDWRRRRAAIPTGEAMCRKFGICKGTLDAYANQTHKSPYEKINQVAADVVSQFPTNGCADLRRVQPARSARG